LSVAFDMGSWRCFSIGPAYRDFFLVRPIDSKVIPVYL
jgi:hypothetical protein